MDLANKLPKIKDQEKESKFGYVFAVSGPGKRDRDQIPAHLICIAIPQLLPSCESFHIFHYRDYIGLLLFYVVVTAENMSGAAMYELVSRNLSESKAMFVKPIMSCQYLY